ncbi:hypothetical protein [Xenophilus azovorans]|uniref:hypothetical protein n=1 Tax=Xenophilus azovorans TaxID=151755 RepID=UPI0005719443|nr:hypothetical protein [Xenophilus azovorans]
MRASRLPAAWLALAAPALAWAAPGEDPVVLTQKQNVNMLPTAPAPRSSDAVLTDGMPSWLRARVVRFESKAMGNPAGMRTDKDLTTQAASEGMNKTCIQDLGAAAPAGNGFSQYGPKGQDQVVVLRGDVVNVCR